MSATSFAEHPEVDLADEKERFYPLILPSCNHPVGRWRRSSVYWLRRAGTNHNLACMHDMSVSESRRSTPTDGRYEMLSCCRVGVMTSMSPLEPNSSSVPPRRSNAIKAWQQSCESMLGLVIQLHICNRYITLPPPSILLNVSRLHVLGNDEFRVPGNGIYLDALGEPKSGTSWLGRLVPFLALELCGSFNNLW